MTDTITLATWEQATERQRDTNPFDYIERTLIPHDSTAGAYEIIRSYPDQVSECLPEHIAFVDHRFVTTAAASDREADRKAIAAAIAEADERHRRLVEAWLS